MRFLLNMNMCRAVGETLGRIGQEWAHARDLGLAHAEDATIIERARRDDQVIVTHDLDYGDILVLSGARGPSVIIFRMRVSAPAAMGRRLEQAWPGIRESLGEGAIVVLEDASVRIRLLAHAGA